MIIPTALYPNSIDGTRTSAPRAPKVFLAAPGDARWLGNDVARRFEEVAQVLSTLDLDQVWEAATDAERRVLLDEYLESVTVLPDHLEVTIAGAPRLHVLYQDRTQAVADRTCRRGDPYSTPTLVLRTELALAG